MVGWEGSHHLMQRAFRQAVKGVNPDALILGALALYSQEYQSMQFELLQAARRMGRSGEPGDDDGSARSIYESARRKLTVIGASEEEIKRSSATPNNSIRSR